MTRGVNLPEPRLDAASPSRNEGRDRLFLGALSAGVGSHRALCCSRRGSRPCRAGNSRLQAWSGPDREGTNVSTPDSRVTRAVAKWSLTLGEPYPDVYPGNFVSRCTLSNGTQAVIKTEP